MALPVPIPRALLEDPKVRRRFYAKIHFADDVQGACWEWTAFRPKGIPGGSHGRFMLNNSPRLAHRISWELHRGPIPDGMCVLHTCCNPPCVNPRHLYIGTQADNSKDTVRDGNSTRGEAHGLARLTEAEARAAHRRYRSGETQTAIAAEFGVDNSTISKVIRGDTWKHVKP